VTPDSASWGEIERFLESDGWREIPGSERGGKRQTHIFFEKQLGDERMLQTHISHDRSTRPSPGAFSSILRLQLEVSRGEFWEALRSGEPVERPVELDSDRPVEHEAWVIGVLVGELHMSAAEIEPLTEEEAKQLVYEHWSKPKGFEADART
jgi:hypothetical protein